MPHHECQLSDQEGGVSPTVENPSRRYGVPDRKAILDVSLKSLTSVVSKLTKKQDDYPKNDIRQVMRPTVKQILS